MRLDIIRPFAAFLRKQLDLSQDQEEIAVYGLQVIIYPLVDFLCICLAGWLLGCLSTTVVIALTVASLRIFSYGAHSKSAVTCALLGVVMFPVLARMALVIVPYINYSGMLLTVSLGFLITIFLVWRLAPVDSPAKRINSPEDRQKLRLQAAIVVLLVTGAQFLLMLSRAQALAVVLAMSFGLWWQTFTLTRPGHWFATLLDKIIIGKEGMPNEASNL